QGRRGGAHVVADHQAGGVVGGADHVSEGATERLGDFLVPFLGYQAADVVRLDDRIEFGHTVSLPVMWARAPQRGGAAAVSAPGPSALCCLLPFAADDPQMAAAA